MPRNCATYSVNAPCLPVSGRNLKKNCAPILVSYDVEQPGTGNSGGTAAGARDTSHAARQLSFERRDRKSTRLNSSHVRISYAVFCLKKKRASREQGPCGLHCRIQH